MADLSGINHDRGPRPRPRQPPKQMGTIGADRRLFAANVFSNHLVTHLCHLNLTWMNKSPEWYCQNKEVDSFYSRL